MLRGQELAQRRAEGVVADTPNERDARTGASRGDRLIRAFPTGHELQIVATDRLAGRRQPLDARRDVHVDAAGDQNAPTRAARVPSGHRLRLLLRHERPRSPRPAEPATDATT